MARGGGRRFNRSPEVAEPMEFTEPMESMEAMPMDDPSEEVAPEEEAPRESPVEVPKKATFDRDKKIAEIRASNMPDEEKEKYIASLTPPALQDPQAITIDIYARMRSITPVKLAAMREWPAAKAVRRVRAAEWDRIFEGF